jgi:peptide/nickel transport system permease protein
VIAYLVRRVINYIILTVIATLLTYVLASYTLNPEARYQGRNPPMSPNSIHNILAALGQDPNVPVVKRAITWFGNIILHGDFGMLYNNQPVVNSIITRSGISLQLLLVGTFLGSFLGVVFGVWGAVRQYRLSDQVVTTLSFLVLSTPVFVLGVLLMIVATRFNAAVGHQVISFTGQYTPGISGVGPVVLDRISHLVLPTIALVMTGAASYSRYQRSVMLDVLASDFIRTARSKGRRRGSAMIRHGVRVALIPMSTFFAYNFGLLVTGSTFLETVFSWHGMGELALTSITQHDINGAAGSVCYVAILVLLASTLSEILYAALDPRVRV